MKIAICGFVILICLASGTLTAQSPADDVLGTILEEAGFTRDDLGYRPTGYWNRFPLDVPYRLTSFDALFAEPLKLSDYATVMANTVETYLDPAYADSIDDGLYKLVYNLGVDKKLGGFRSYSANLRTVTDSTRPLASAVRGLFELAGRQTEHAAFGQSSPWPDLQAEVTDKVTVLPDSVRFILADLLVNLTDAIHWRNLAFRNCDPEDMRRAFDIRDLASTQSDGTVYYPELDDIANTLDWPSLHYAALKTAAATEQAEHRLKRFTQKVPVNFEMEIETPFGRIAILAPGARLKTDKPPRHLKTPTSKIGYDEYDATGTLLVVDFGRNMMYQGCPGATTSLSNPVSVLLDLRGNDYYGFERNTYPPTTGVGLLGIGLVLDSKGDDHYNGSTFAQGAGLLGVGVLLDREGDDHYRAELSAQGCGYFGIGLCLDATGKDDYYLYASGQGLGGVGGGIGVCASFDGDDKYTAEPYASVYDRGDYHSEHTINGNEAQGAGFGRRGDGSDGHAWAGGLGAIIDIHGSDHYYSGNWTLGVGYWFGTGIAVDRNGDDKYESCYFTQGSGAHYCNGILLDENGNDRHELYETAGAGLGFGWDYTNAFLINKNGNDIYRARIISMGLAQIRSTAFLIDIGGDDTYYLGKGTAGLGEATYREDYDKPSKLTPYYTYAKSFGGFIDIGGKDAYWEFSEDGETEHPRAKNDTLWNKPAREEPHYGAENHGVGIDTGVGTIPELFKWR